MTEILLTEQPARRGFLRSLFAAPVAALATHKLILPANALVTPGDAAARLAHHVAGAEVAFGELYPHGEILQWGSHNRNAVTDLRKRFFRGKLSGDFVLDFSTIQPEPIPENLRQMLDKFERTRGLRGP
ncbi:MAG: hypothetical protein EKK29_05855 [Hyphomicrobiales bacterium]|nr:MAG: hypothetical protein EKK29_05855 [Hyphomicrobiales bacterium]